MTPAPDATDPIPPEARPRLEAYAALLRQWQARINLVAPATLPDLWRRHIADSAQLAPHVPPGTARLADLGSGAGFPGLVLAILGVAREVHLVEADSRKAAFLAEAARVTGTHVTLHTCRIESLPPLAADLVTARALAPLPRLLPLVHRHLAEGGRALLPKGRGVADELTEAAPGWTMTLDSVPSATEPDARLLIVADLTPRAERHKASG